MPARSKTTGSHRASAPASVHTADGAHALGLCPFVGPPRYTVDVPDDVAELLVTEAAPEKGRGKFSAAGNASRRGR
jgi:hypothetical protein